MTKPTGENLKTIRSKRNITQTRLGTELGISQEAISGYENNGYSMRIEHLIDIANFLNTSVDYLLERTNNDAPITEILENIADKQLEELLNNYAQLNNYQRNDLIWYSNALKQKKDF